MKLIYRSQGSARVVYKNYIKIFGELISKIRALINSFINSTNTVENEICTDEYLSSLDEALIESSNLILTPNVYSDGWMKLIKTKIEDLQDLVLNGNFADNSEWQSYSGGTLSVNNNIGYVNGNGLGDSGILQDITVTQGKKYLLKGYLRSNGLGGNPLLTTLNTVENIYIDNSTEQWVEVNEVVEASSTNIIIYLREDQGSKNVMFKDISLKPIADFEFERGSESTRINDQGLVEEVIKYGDELIVNGGFDSSDGYILSNFTISDGVATFNDLSSGYLQRNDYPTIEDGKNYLVSFDILNENAYIRFVNNKGNVILFNWQDLTPGSYSFITTATGTGRLTRIFASTARGTFSIDNISVKEIIRSNDLPRINYENFDYKNVYGEELVVNGGFDTDLSNWDIPNGNPYVQNSEAIISNDCQGIAYPLDLVIGKKYLIKFQIKNPISNADDIIVKFTTSKTSYAGTEIIATVKNIDNDYQNFSIEWTSIYADTRLYIRKNFITDIINIDNVSIKEITGEEIVEDSGCGSILLEPNSTNLIVNSEDFSKSSWIQSAIGGVESNSTLAPNNELVATKIIERNALNSRHYIRRATIGSMSLSDYSMSVYAKKGERSWLKLSDDSDGTNTQAYFDLENGVVGNTSSNITSANIVKHNNGWYRCEIIFTNKNTNLYTNVGVSLENNDTYDGDGISGLYIWGVQLEELSFGTSYIPTISAPVTRSKDILKNGSCRQLFNDTYLFLYLHSSCQFIGSVSSMIRISDGSNNNYINLQFKSDDTLSVTVLASGLTQNSTSIKYTDYGVTNLDFNKIGITKKNNLLELYLNGTKVRNVLSGNMPTGLDQIHFEANGLFQYYGKLKCLMTFKDELTTEQKETLTTL